MYSNLTLRNKSALKRFSHRRRFEIALDLLDPRSGERILDYGTGDGHMLNAILLRSPKCAVYGYEPVVSMHDEVVAAVREQNLSGQISIATDLGTYENAYFDKISCLEVLEHLTESNRKFSLKAMKFLLRPKGRLLISVPIETGLSSLAKNLARVLLGQAHENTTFANVARSLIGAPVDRGSADFISSHIGFDYKNIEALVCAEGFVILKKTFSPLKLLGSVLNSQVFYVLAHSSR